MRAAQIHLLTSKATRIKRTAQTMMDNTDNRVKVKNFHGIATCAQRVAGAFLFAAVKNFHVRCAGPSECGSCAATREIAARATAATAALAIARVAACHCARQGLGVRTVVCGCGRAGVWVVSAAVFAAAVLW